MGRKKIIIANWKMNKTPNETREFSKSLRENIESINCDLVICPSFICIPYVCEFLYDTEVAIGSQNVSYEEEGAFTGEVSPLMLLDMNVRYSIIGHSERRRYFGESDEDVNKKIHCALRNNILPITCFGESDAERTSKLTEKVIERQLTRAFRDVSLKDIQNVTIAYEPIWAIGTGNIAKKEQIIEVCRFIRNLVTRIYDKKTADKIRITYGGSVNETNAIELLDSNDIDGALLGNASLDIKKLLKIVESI